MKTYKWAGCSPSVKNYMIASGSQAHTSRLTPEQFKALAKYKGWKYTMLAERWELSRVWISVKARDPNRPFRYDDMLRGLPNLNKLGRDLARLTKEIDQAMGRAVKKAAAVAANNPLPLGYRYRGYMVLGAITVASTTVGSIAEEGMRGVVFQVIDNGIEESYGVIFETGLWDWFSPRYVDDYLVTSGLLDERNAGYSFDDEVVLQADFESGAFDFWPAVDLV